MRSARQGFQSTHWSLVRRAGDIGGRDHEEALLQLCDEYWYPVYAFVRWKVNDAHQAEDLTQSFFLKLLEKNYIAAADEGLGKFRTFLLTAVKRFLANEHDRVNAKMRGGGRRVLSLDFDSGAEKFAREHATRDDLEKEFNRVWAHQVLDIVLERIFNQFQEQGKQEEFEILRPALSPQEGALNYPELAKKLGVSASSLRVSVHRLRKRYRDLLVEEISKTLSDPAEANEEIASLFSAFQR